MRAPVVTSVLVLLVACGAGKDGSGSYLDSFSFARIAPEGLDEDVLSEDGPMEDSAGLHVRYARESRVRLGETEPDAFATTLAASAKKDLEARGFTATIVNNETAIRFVKFSMDRWSGTVFIHAKKEPDGTVRLIFRINEAEKR